jgi:hypothetical protein
MSLGAPGDASLARLGKISERSNFGRRRMTTSTSWSVIGIVSVMTGFSLLGACSSSESAKPSAAAEAGAGTGGKSGSGGKSTGGARSTAGSTSSGGAAAVDAASTCTKAIDVTCDGPEDCPAGQRCCGKWDQAYQMFGCFDSCTAQQVDAGQALWFDLCHPGDACEDSTATCLTSTYLTSSLSRCYTMGSPPDPKFGNGKGQVNCGTDVCGASEKCCMRGVTLAPYCAPSGATCECTAPSPKPAGAGGAPQDAAARD